MGCPNFNRLGRTACERCDLQVSGEVAKEIITSFVLGLSQVMTIVREEFLFSLNFTFLSYLGTCRDLNPNNVLLADNGSVKLTYFCRYPNVDPILNCEAKEKLYVAPEVDGTSCNVSFASDWWSFGAILYELTTLQVRIAILDPHFSALLSECDHQRLIDSIEFHNI